MGKEVRALTDYSETQIKKLHIVQQTEKLSLHTP